MGVANYTYNRSTSGGEIITHLINATDGEGLHFDGAGSIDFTPVDLGTAFSFEFITQADSWAASTYKYLIDIGLASDSAKRFTFGSDNSAASNLKVRYGTTWVDFGVAILDDLKVHHLCVTVDGTSAILYDNGNQVGTATIGSHSIDDCDVAGIASNYTNTGDFFNGTLYRTRFWNKTLSQAEVTASYENATVNFADQYGSQTAKITGTDSTFNSGLGSWSTGNNWDTQTNLDAKMQLAATATDQRCYLNVGLVAGKRYRFTYDAEAITGEVTLRGYGSAYITFGTLVAGTAKTIEFVATGISVSSIYIGAVASGAAITLNNLTLVEIGCVADYDLAFAQPEISLMVQDRAGAADGTSSATGVSQVTKIEAVNTNKLNVGGTTPLVGIGLPAGITPSRQLSVYGTLPYIALQSSGSGTGVSDGFQIQHVAADNKAYIWNYEAADMVFGTANTTCLTIDSAGNVGIGGSPTSESSVARYLYIGDTASAGIVLDDTNSTPWDIYNVQGSLYFAPNGGAESVTISAAGLATFSNGIAFTQTGTSATGAATTSSTLDHYEEGTWTPTWTGATASDATYTRIGRLVYVSGKFAATGAGTSGDCGGLPFASGIDGSDGGGSGYHNQDTVAWNVLKISASSFRFYTGSTQAQLTSSYGARFFLTYHV